MIVTMDGPAGAGKSSVASALAARLGFRFLDTGAMYRTVALAMLRNGWDALSEAEAAERTAALQLEFDGDRSRLNGEDVSDSIRSPRVTRATKLSADNPFIREQLVRLQRQLAANVDAVTEGRDQGTVAFPDADCKIFLTATPEERARRRQLELVKSGVELPWDTVLQQIIDRDERDRNRAVGRLLQAEDAIRICTDGMTREQVIDRLEATVRACQQNS